LSARQYTAENARATGAAFVALLKLDAQDAEVLRLRQAWFDDFRRALAEADTPERLAAFKPAIEQLKKDFGTGTDALQQALAQATAAVEARELARLEAISGTLVLNAYPWGNVESVVDQSNNQPVALPKERSTPLRLKIPAGTYRVTFKHPQVGKPVALVASVTAKKDQVANAQFPTLTADAYLKRAGYAQ
jgi:hypothetical protein